MDQQLLAYIEQELKRGVRSETVKKALCDAGWEKNIVEEAFLSVQSKTSAPVPRTAAAPVNLDSNHLPEGFIGEDLPEKSKKLSTLKIVLGVAALIFAGITVFLYLMEDSGSTEIISQELFNESLPPAGGAASVQVSEEETSLSVLDQNEEVDGIIDDNMNVDALNQNEELTAAENKIASSDDQRKADMEKLVEAQKAWFAAKGKYYTCGLGGGDCGGKPHGYPLQIGEYLATTPKDPSGAASGTCGSSYIYCGLNNAPYPHFFCYYAKLESGGYYTASHQGNFLRQTPPKIFEECATAN